MNTPNIFDRLSRKIHHHSDMEPHESDSGPPFGEVEPLNFHDEESVVHTVLEDFYAVGTLADELTAGFHMEAHGYLDREEVNTRLIDRSRKAGAGRFGKRNCGKGNRRSTYRGRRTVHGC